MQSKIFYITSIYIFFFTEETTINGYRIPRRTIIVANLWTINNDSFLYSESSKFDPKRFIDENGKRVKTEGPYPFGVGKYTNLIPILVMGGKALVCFFRFRTEFMLSHHGISSRSNQSRKMLFFLPSQGRLSRKIRSVEITMISALSHCFNIQMLPQTVLKSAVTSFEETSTKQIAGTPYNFKSLG